VRILVAGASGFIGSRLCPVLKEEGHEVRALTRRPERYAGAGTAVAGDVDQPGTLRPALEGCDVAYYLVHALHRTDFATRDAAAARAFGRAAAEAGVQRIVYLGGLGDESSGLSAHLRSRREVERLLGEAGVPVTVLRAGVVVGHGSTSWELTRQLVEHLPLMVTPQWVSTRCQPIAADDVVRYLVGVLSVPETVGRVFDIGGADVLEYREMLTRVAAIEGRHLTVLPVPVLSPRLSSHWLALVTDLDLTTGRALVDSMTNEVVVRDDAIRGLVPFEPLGYDEMVLLALGERARSRRGDPPRAARLRGQLAGAVARLTTPVPYDHRESDTELRHRRLVVVGTGTVAAGLLRRALTRPPGSASFYGYTAAVAATWAAGGVAAGRLHLGREHGPDLRLRRPTVVPVATGVAAFGAAYGAALAVRRVPAVHDALHTVLGYADVDSVPLTLVAVLANGVAEEVFFRGALYAAVPEGLEVPASTVAYTLTAAGTGNPAMVLAAGAMGTLFALQRKYSGGIQASTLTHVTWSTLVLRYLTPLVRGCR
jgi:uncharacterized protein YbjT (DUF2867 family)/membrane protease YdiL (CAAX protease family)